MGKGPNLRSVRHPAEMRLRLEHLSRTWQARDGIRCDAIVALSALLFRIQKARMMVRNLVDES
jgi:hypothetical protein